MSGVSKAERVDRVAAALDRVGLKGFGPRNPGELSGGQQQRVAIARAIVAEPKLVLFDEPLSNLDRELRETMVSEIGQLVSGLGLTTIYVTHDQSEAFTLADQVAVMRAGKIVQLAAPDMLVEQPADAGIAEFLRLGTMARVEYRDAAWWLAGTNIRLGGETCAAHNGANRVLVPPKAIRLANPAGAALTGTVTRSQFRGDKHVATVRVGTALDLQVTSETRLRVAENVGLVVEPERLRWFSSATSQIE
jgi:iron(III) transport system ATP-binding protein